MILSFSEFMPWANPKGGKIRTYFLYNAQVGRKKHTFRMDGRWTPGMKIHPYSNNPRNGGKPFNFQVQHAENWHSELTGKTLHKTQFDFCPITYLPSHKQAVPLLDGFEPFKFRFEELGENGTMVALYIDEALMFSVNYNIIDNTVTHKDGRQYLRLCEIAEKDGLKTSDFLRWFIHLSRKHGQKEITGKLLHWTPFRYVADRGIDPFIHPDETGTGFPKMWSNAEEG